MRLHYDQKLEWPENQVEKAFDRLCPMRRTERNLRNCGRTVHFMETETDTWTSSVEISSGLSLGATSSDLLLSDLHSGPDASLALLIEVVSPLKKETGHL